MERFRRPCVANYKLYIHQGDTYKLSYVWQALSTFVKDGTYDRDPTHGYQHMKQVALTSLDILYNMFKDVGNIDGYRFIELYIPVMIVAWLHDYADHKYDVDGSMLARMTAFVERIYPEEAYIITQAIKYVSYSEENKLFDHYLLNDEDYQRSLTILRDTRKHNFEPFLGPKYVIVRNIVSDADKIEALGLSGMKRCADYCVERRKKDNLPCDETIINKYVINHVKYKLMHLLDDYIHTSYGKQLAKPKHDELIDLYNELLSSQI